jgi:hypothetical protein
MIDPLRRFMGATVPFDRSLAEDSPVWPLPFTNGTTSVNSVSGTRDDGDPVALNLELFDRLANAKGWINDAQRADGIGVARSTMSRVRNGVSGPGAKFMHGSLSAFGGDIYNALFVPAGRGAA